MAAQQAYDLLAIHDLFLLQRRRQRLEARSVRRQNLERAPLPFLDQRAHFGVDQAGGIFTVIAFFLTGDAEIDGAAAADRRSAVRVSRSCLAA